MIEFTREGSKVKATMTSRFGVLFEFTWNAGTEWAAQYLEHDLCDCVWQKLTDARRDAYLQGWKDAKGKQKPKATWWTGRW